MYKQINRACTVALKLKRNLCCGYYCKVFFLTGVTNSKAAPLLQPKQPESIMKLLLSMQKILRKNVSVYALLFNVFIDLAFVTENAR